MKTAHKAMKSYPTLKLTHIEVCFFMVFVSLYKKMSFVMLCCQLADSSKEFVFLFQDNKLLSYICEEVEAILLRPAALSQGCLLV